MATREDYNKLLPLSSFDTQLINGDTTTNGNIIDTADFDGGILHVIQMGVRTTGDATPLLEESDDSGMSGSNVIADKNIVPVNIGGTWFNTGQEAASILDATNEIRAIATVGTKRYQRLSFVTDNTGLLTIGATVLKHGELQSVYGLAV